jgi:hypothetical protein
MTSSKGRQRPSEGKSYLDKECALKRLLFLLLSHRTPPAPLQNSPNVIFNPNTEAEHKTRLKGTKTSPQICFLPRMQLMWGYTENKQLYKLNINQFVASGPPLISDLPQTPQAHIPP